MKVMCVLSRQIMSNDILRLSSLALVLSLGCSDIKTPSNRPPEDTSPSVPDDYSAPIHKAPPQTRIPGEYVVVFIDGSENAVVESAADWVAQAGGLNRVIYRYAVVPGFSAYLDDTALSRLRRNPNVAYVEENQLFSLAAVSNSPARGIDRVDQRSGRDGLYNDHGRDGAGVHLYFLDTGINTRHSEFKGRIDEGFTAINDGLGVEDCNGHGSHVSSTAAGTTYGMAKQARIHPVRILDCLGAGSLSGVVAGVNFVHGDCLSTGLCIANMSVTGAASAVLNQSLANAVARGISFVAAAGNEDCDACANSPAGSANAITVAAIDDADRRASFSNWGSCVDLFAPGTNILGAWIGDSDSARLLNGTSMASAHVAGTSALYLGASPGATPAHVRSGLQASASLDCVDDPKGAPNVLLFSDLNQGNGYCGNLEGGSSESL